MFDPLVQLYLLRRHVPLASGESSKENLMHDSPTTSGQPKIEPKVKAGSAGAYLGLLALLAPLQAIQADLDLIAALPDWLETLAIPLVPGLIAYVAGYVAKHARRPDLPQSQR